MENPIRQNYILWYVDIYEGKPQLEPSLKVWRTFPYTDMSDVRRAICNMRNADEEDSDDEWCRPSAGEADWHFMTLLTDGQYLIAAYDDCSWSGMAIIDDFTAAIENYLDVHSQYNCNSRHGPCRSDGMFYSFVVDWHGNVIYQSSLEDSKSKTAIGNFSDSADPDAEKIKWLEPRAYMLTDPEPCDGDIHPLTDFPFQPEIPNNLQLRFTTEWLHPLQESCLTMPRMEIGESLTLCWQKPDAEWVTFHLKVAYDQILNHDLYILTWQLSIDDRLPFNDDFKSRMLQVSCVDKEYTWEHCFVAWRNDEQSRFMATKSRGVSADTTNITFRIYYDA